MVQHIAIIQDIAKSAQYISPDRKLMLMITQTKHIANLNLYQLGQHEKGGIQ